MPKLTDFLGRPHSGIVPHTVIGVVVDNVDPDELGRIKVKFPTLPDDPQSWWLRVASPNAGKERGFYALPEKDDEVLVLFLQGSQDVGVIVGQFWNGVDVPPAEAKDGLPGSGATDAGSGLSTEKFSDGSTSLDKNDRRFWKSRSGHLFVFDDTDGAESVQIWDKSHKLSLAFDSAAGLITLASAQGDIHIRAANIWIDAETDIKVKAGNNWEAETGTDAKWKTGSNFKVEATSNIDMKATSNISMEATSNFTAKATANATMEASVGATVKGTGTAELNSSGATTVKGSVVNIN